MYVYGVLGTTAHGDFLQRVRFVDSAHATAAERLAVVTTRYSGYRTVCNTVMVTKISHGTATRAADP